MSRLYEKACRFVNSHIGISTDELRERREEKEEEYLKAKERMREKEGKRRESRIVHGKDSREFRKASQELEKAQKRLEQTKNEYKRDGFRKTMQFTNMDLEYEDVLIFSVFMSLVSAFFVIGSVIVYNHFVSLTILELIAYGVPITVVVPALVLLFIANYPDMLEQRLKVNSLGKAPESINYMTMSMRVRPSLHRAIVFAAKNTDEPISSGLNKIIWDVYTRKRSNLEESFLSFALEWGEWNDSLKRSLYAVRSSLLEKTEQGMKKSLARANKIVINGTKKEIKDFTESLRTPTTILFSIGILLPLIIGAMLPMIALSGLDVKSIASETAVKSPTIGLPLIVLLMDVVSPLGAFLYSYKILGDRPGTTAPPDVESMSDNRKKMVISLGLGAGLSFIVFLLYPVLKSMMPLPLFLPVVVPVSYYCLSTTWKEREERNRVKEMESEFPDALFQLGSRIAEGVSPEMAIYRTGETMEGTEIGKLFKRITSTLQVKGLSIDEALFGTDGILVDFPSRDIGATMKTVIEISKKDPKEAGNTIIQIANFKQDMADMDHEIRSNLSQSVEMMKGTALIFAPIVMGIVASLYFMLEGVFSEMASIDMVSPVVFTAVLEVYLILIGLVITYFTTGIERRGDILEFKHSFGVLLLVTVSVFSVAVTIGRYGLIGS